MGKITINTGFDLTGFRDGFNKAMNATKRFVDSVTKNISGIGKSFDSSTAAIRKQQAIVDELKSKMQALSDIEAKTPAFEKLTADSKAAELELKNLSAEYDKAVATLAQFREMGFRDVDLSTQIEDVERLAIAMEASESKAAILRQELLDLDMPQKPKETAEQLTSKLEIAEKKLSEMKDKAAQFGKTAPKAMRNTGREAQKAAGGIEKLFNRLKSLIVAAFVFNIIRKALREFRDYIGLALKDNQAFVNSFGQIKGNLQTAFQPILDFIIPALNSLMNALIPVTQALVRFVSLVSGKSISAMQSQAKALNAVGKSANGAAKDLNKFLAPFDEIMQPSATGAGAGAGAAAEEIAPLFEDMSDIDFSWIDTFKEKLLDIVPDLDYFFGIGKGIGEKIAAGLAAIPWNKIRAWGVSFIEKLAALLNGLVESGLIQQFGATFGEAINTALLFAYTWFTSFDFLAFGVAIAEGLNNAMSIIDWALLGMTITAGIIAALSTIGAVIRTINWKKIGSDIKTFLINIDWGGIANELFRVIGNALGGMALFIWGLIEDGFNGMANYFKESIEEMGGDIVGGLLFGIIDALVGIATWLYDNVFKPFVSGFKEMFGIHSPSTVMAELGVFIMEGLFNGITSTIDTIIGLFSGLWDGIKEVWSVVVGWFDKEVMTPLSKGFKTSINGIIGFFEGMANAVISSIESMVNGAIQLLNNLISGINKIPGIKVPYLGELTIPRVSIPRLATGTVVPPNKEFMAILGDNKNEPEIVAPESTIKQMVLEAIAEAGGIGGGNVTIEAHGNTDEIIRFFNFKIKQEQNRQGGQFSNRVVAT